MTIKIYSTPTCPYCNMAKKMMDDKGVEYQNLDVSKDREMAKEMIIKSGQRSVPVIDIDGEIIIGFDKVRLEQLLG